MSADPTRPLPEWRQEWSGPAEPQTVARPRRPRRRRRGPSILLITLLVIVVLVVVSDRVANAYAENKMASQVQSSLALSGKPDVTIHGFPFWTQLMAKDFKNVTVTASNETINLSSAGNGALEIESLTPRCTECTSTGAAARRSTSSAPPRWSPSRRWGTSAASRRASR